MPRTLRHLITAGAACFGGLVILLAALTAVAGANRWTAIGPDGANVVALAIDPRNPSTAFAGTLRLGNSENR